MTPQNKETPEAAKARAARAAAIRTANPAGDVVGKIGPTTRLSFRRGTEIDQPLLDTALSHAKRIEEWPAFTREVYARVWDPTGVGELPEGEASTWGQKAVAMLEAQPDFPEVREAAQASSSLARRTTRELSQRLATALGVDRMTEEDDRARDPRSAQAALDRFMEWNEANPADDEKQKERRDAVVADMQGDVQLCTARRAMIDAAADDAARRGTLAGLVKAVAASVKPEAEAIKALRGFGIGCGGGDGGEGQEEIPHDLVQSFLTNPLFRKVLEMAGRMLEAAQGGETEIGDGRCDVVGVTRGSDIARLLPSERLALSDDGMIGLDAMRRVVEGAADLWEMRGTEERKRGDLLLAGDRSGSMSGQRIVAARGLLGAALLMAVRAKRRVSLVMFDHTQRSCLVHADGTGMVDALRLLALPAAGGTDANAALLAGAKLLPKLREPDVVIVTDGVFDRLRDDVLAKAKGKDGRLFAITLDYNLATMHGADEIIAMSSADPTGASTKVLTALNGKRKTLVKPPPAPADDGEELPF